MRPRKLRTALTMKTVTPNSDEKREEDEQCLRAMWRTTTGCDVQGHRLHTGAHQ
jgi:hypothetical protein